MTSYSIVTEDDMIELAKLSEQQKNQRDIKNFLKKFSKQTHNEELAETFRSSLSKKEILNNSAKNSDPNFLFSQEK